MIYGAHHDLAMLTLQGHSIGLMDEIMECTARTEARPHTAHAYDPPLTKSTGGYV